MTNTSIEWVEEEKADLLMECDLNGSIKFPILLNLLLLLQVLLHLIN